MKILDYKIFKITIFQLIILMLITPFSSKANESDIQEILVVGSRINNKNFKKILPVTVINSEELKVLGIDSGDDLIMSLVENGTNRFNDAGNAIAGVNSARGDMGAFNLRNLGTGNTLVLINGRRLINSPSFQSESVGGSFVPVNSVNTNIISINSIERVEVLKDGSSAIYGADAVAGVINFVTKKNKKGLELSFKNSEFENFDRSDYQFGFNYGSSFNSNKTNINISYNHYEREPIRASKDQRMGISDWRTLPQILDTEWATTRFRRNSINSPYGQFDFVDSIKEYEFYNEKGLTDSSGEFEIFPSSDSKCLVDLGNQSCIAKDTSTKRYNLNQERWVVSDLERDNFQFDLLHEFKNGVEGFTEFSFYNSKTKQNNSPSAAFSSSKLIVPPSNYWNPFGAKTFADGAINPNRLSEIEAPGIPEGGLAIIIDNYRYVDVGPRRISVEKDTFRILQGFRGVLQNWDWEVAGFISEASSDDITSNRLSNSLMEQALSISSVEAYNPFNGGGDFDKYLLTSQDGTPNIDGAIQNAIIDVYRKGKRKLKSIDIRFNNFEFLKISGGFASISVGAEYREDSFEDDRDPRLDGTIQYTDKDGDTYPFVSDVMNSSPTPDNFGERDVLSAFAELGIPLISNEMGIPLIKNFDLQLAARHEDFSDIGSKSVPKISFGWQIDDSFYVRGSWSKGFRVPNLVQINETIVSRQIFGVDALLCLQQISNNGEIDYCDYSFQRVARGSKNLRPEESTNISFGIIYEPKNINNLVFTLDWWEIEKEDTIGLFGEDNILLSDLVLRMETNNISNCSLVQSSPYVFRDALEENEIQDYLKAGICPAGRVTRVEEQYRNLDTRIISGFDFSTRYFINSDYGNFNFIVNISKLEKFKQKAGNDFVELIDAQEKGIIPEELAITGFSDLIEKDGSPKIQANFKFLWNRGSWGFGLFGMHIGEFYETRNKLSDGRLWKVKAYNKINTFVDYNFKIFGSQSNLRFGINNIADERAPLASDIFGYYIDKHDNLGRSYYINFIHRY